MMHRTVASIELGFHDYGGHRNGGSGAAGEPRVLKRWGLTPSFLARHSQQP
jgi:hypothetical protein